MRFFSKELLIGGAGMGLVSGVLWFWIGGTLDEFFGSILSWVIVPAVLPLLISSFYVAAGQWRPASAVFFAVVYYFFHWVPAVTICILIFLGIAIWGLPT
jgi:hypothetical protein